MCFTFYKLNAQIEIKALYGKQLYMYLGCTALNVFSDSGITDASYLCVKCGRHLNL